MAYQLHAYFWTRPCRPPGWAPAISSSFWPSLNTIKVGMALIPHSWEISGWSSTSTLTNLIELYCGSEASLSKTGLIIRHGPHHGAQKSIMTTWPELMRVWNSERLVKHGKWSVVLLRRLGLFTMILYGIPVKRSNFSHDEVWTMIWFWEEGDVKARQCFSSHGIDGCDYMKKMEGGRGWFISRFTPPCHTDLLNPTSLGPSHNRYVEHIGVSCTAE